MPNAFKSNQNVNVTTETTVYTGPASTQTTAIGMTVTNVGTSVAKATVKLNTAHLVKAVDIPVGAALVVIGGDQKVVVETGDTIKVSSDVTVDVILSYLEIS